MKAQSRKAKAAELMDKAEAIVLAVVMSFPKIKAEIHSTNRWAAQRPRSSGRTDVRCSSPMRMPSPACVGAILLEQNDEWARPPSAR